MSLKYLKIIVGLIILVSFYYTVHATVDPDLWWHLKVGHWIAENKEVPRYDIYSHTMTGYRWVDHEWLVDYLLWQARSRNLWLLVEILFSLLMLAPFLFWIKRAKHRFTLWLTLLPAVYLVNVAGVRPQWISFFLFFLVFEMLRKRYVLSEKSRWFYTLPVVFLIWANLHAGFAFGLAVFGLSLLTAFFINRRKGLVPNKTGLLIFALSIGATFINPYGAELYSEIYRVALSSSTLKHIAEWQPPLVFFNIPLVLYSAVFLSFIIFGRSYRKYDKLSLFLSLLGFGLFMRSTRHGPLFFIMAIPVLFDGYGIIRAGIAKARQGLPFSANERRKMKIVLAILFVGTLGILLNNIYADSSYPQPEKAVAFLKGGVETGKNIVLFNDYGWGGYLIYHLPEIPVFVDGRMPHWQRPDSSSAMNDFISATENPDDGKWKEIFKKYEINTVLLIQRSALASDKKTILTKIKQNAIQGASGLTRLFKEKQDSRPLKDVLAENGWRVAHEDRIAIILYAPGLGSAH